MEIRYRELISKLADDFPDVPRQYWPQYVSRWKKVLDLTQAYAGWYETEDYVGLRALCEAYRRHKMRGPIARDYAYDQVKKWRQFNGN